MNVLATRFLSTNDIFWGRIPQMPGAYTYGETEKQFEANAREWGYSWLEEIETGRVSHKDSYPHGMSFIKEYYGREDDAMTAISSLAAAVYEVWYPSANKAVEQDTILHLAMYGVIAISAEDVMTKDAEIVFIEL